MKVKKIIVLSSLLLVVVILSGCFKKQTKTENSQQLLETSEKQENQAKSMAESIKDAITKGKKMECKTKIGSDGDMVESKFSVQGEKYRSEVETEAGKFISVSDGKIVHTWNSETKEGTKVDLNCVKDLEISAPEGSENDYEYSTYKSSEDIVDNATEIDCKPVSLIDFSIPADVSFIDQCEMLKNAQEAMKKFNIPQIQP